MISKDLSMKFLTVASSQLKQRRAILAVKKMI